MAIYEMPEYKREMLNGPKHIKVELDFMPVEEKLPDDFRFYDVLEYGQWYVLRARFCGKQWLDVNVDVVDVTHWAPIPDLTNVKE